MSNSPLKATHPEINATVHASAGTGKTWLLVTRMVRLLLAGARPANLLAVTFTRKAAAEMQQRLTERLADLARADDAALDTQLKQIGLEPSTALRSQARRLYDQLMFNEQRPRTTTFHAFCQEILQRFPVEAEIPPGFELLDSEAQCRELAWASLYAEVTQAPDNELARHLETLYELCNGMHNTHQALNQFLAQRIDWWAFTHDKQYPARWAAAVLKEQLQVDPEIDPVADFFHDLRMQMIREFAQLLAKHDTPTNLKHSAAALSALDNSLNPEQRIDALRSALFTQSGTRMARKSSNPLVKKLGETGVARLLDLHDLLCGALETLQEQQNRIITFQLNRSWYHAGDALLTHYQRIKHEQRLLDFSDLEWKSYQLLNQSEQAHWIQYKLDARIDHLLIDEFQDTNPTQWRLLLPLLEELAAGSSERARSVFLVGDAKQSIYRFRRADARLLEHASQWLGQHFDAEPVHLDRSRRSSQAVIDCVNAVFQQPVPLLEGFPTHTTFNTDLWGEVQLLPLIEIGETEEDIPAIEGLRDPLQQPRIVSEDQRYYREGQLIAEQIKTLIAHKTPIGSDDNARAISYRDILILLRSRNHAPHYERALRDAGIPFLGTARGALLHSIEARDLEALLNTLIAPHNNLALAQVLRCPLFACTDDDLVALAQAPGKDWMERLLALAQTLDDSHPLGLAASLLTQWRQWTGVLPVHDLLDRIYFEGNLLARYLAATPASLQPRVHANLLRFLELALEIDSGRYPSLPRFIHALHSLRELDEDAPDDAAPSSGSDRVQFMTIHGAKGLEAPVVFLADSSSVPRDKSTWSALVDWPAEKSRPAAFFLLADSKRRDTVSAAHKASQDQAATREDANLLYVALTRARQCLYISGTEPSRGQKLGWYGVIQSALGETTGLQSAQPPTIATRPSPVETSSIAYDARLNQPIKVGRQQQRIAPSRQTDFIDMAATHDPDACERGIAIHRFLELMTEPEAVDTEQALHRVAIECARSRDDPDLLNWLSEAQHALTSDTVAHLFTTGNDRRIFKEVPISYRQNGIMIDGVIDRLIVDETQVTLVDFKSSPVQSGQEARQHALAYERQMKLYADGIRMLWPDKTLQTCLLFTHGPYLVPINV